MGRDGRGAMPGHHACRGPAAVRSLDPKVTIPPPPFPGVPPRRASPHDAQPKPRMIPSPAFDGDCSVTGVGAAHRTATAA
jgi:hypothetical protein